MDFKTPSYIFVKKKSQLYFSFDFISSYQIELPHKAWGNRDEKEYIQHKLPDACLLNQNVS